MTEEFYDLSKERLKELHKEDKVPAPFLAYFQRVAYFLTEMIGVFEDVEKGNMLQWDFDRNKEINALLYADINADLYSGSYANPTYAVSAWGSLLSFVYVLMRGCIPDIFDKNKQRFTRHIQYFLELYTSFCDAASEGKIPEYAGVIEDLYDFIFFSYEEECDRHVSDALDYGETLAYDLVMNTDHNDLSYLFRYGEYVTDNQIRTAEYLTEIPFEKLKMMADTFTEGYRIGFEKTGKNLSKKKTVQIEYPIGFEPLVKLAVENFRSMGLEPVMCRDDTGVYFKRYGSSYGYFGENPNRQYEYDHREDIAFFWDKKMSKRRFDCLRNAYEKNKEKAGFMAGPAVIEVFGEKPFSPASCPEAAQLSEEQRNTLAQYYSMQSDMVNEYIPGDERSFTVIAFPISEIGDEYRDIMEETIKINTLDWRVYEELQQKMIDELDTCYMACIKGRDGNETDLTVMLAELKEPSKETKFENCVADVNIPVGEVFTSPVLKGTGGILHVKKVFLSGVEYRDLRITFEDGRVKDYSCANFEDAEEGRKLIESQVFGHNKNLPIGEFAIGTNTAAYMMGNTYEIEDRLPILIAEKTGPHLAVGDTCYSHAEDVRVYNPDGKEIIARDNEISLKRKSEDEAERQRAYFQCHTDITIPYNELGMLWGKKKDGSEAVIIRDGRFVLPGTEKLNEVLE